MLRSMHKQLEQQQQQQQQQEMEHRVESVRVLVVGESGVGKSALVGALLSQRPALQGRSRFVGGAEDGLGVELQWTVGCRVSVKMLRTVAGEEDVFIEFLDIGGSRNYQLGRSVFYHELDGVVFVFDLTNRKSLRSVADWLAEIQEVDSMLKMSKGGSVVDHRRLVSKQPFVSWSGAGQGNGRDQAELHREKNLEEGEGWETKIGWSNSSSSTFTPGSVASASSLESRLAPSVFRERKLSSQPKSQSATLLHGLPMILVGNKADLLSNPNVTIVNPYQRFGIDGVVTMSSVEISEENNYIHPMMDLFYEKVIAFRQGR